MATQEEVEERAVEKLNGLLMEAERSNEWLLWMKYLAYLHGVMTSSIALRIQYDLEWKYWKTRK